MMPTAAGGNSCASLAASVFSRRGVSGSPADGSKLPYRVRYERVFSTSMALITSKRILHPSRKPENFTHVRRPHVAVAVLQSTLRLGWWFMYMDWPSGLGKGQRYTFETKSRGPSSFHSTGPFLMLWTVVSGLLPCLRLS